MPIIRLELANDMTLSEMNRIAQEIYEQHKEWIKDLSMSP